MLPPNASKQDVESAYDTLVHLAAILDQNQPAAEVEVRVCVSTHACAVCGCGCGCMRACMHMRAACWLAWSAVHACMHAWMHAGMLPAHF